MSDSIMILCKDFTGEGATLREAYSDLLTRVARWREPFPAETEALVTAPGRLTYVSTLSDISKREG